MREGKREEGPKEEETISVMAGIIPFTDGFC